MVMVSCALNWIISLFSTNVFRRCRGHSVPSHSSNSMISLRSTLKSDLLVHAAIELVNPVLITQVTLDSEAMPCEPPVCELKVCGTLRQAISPRLQLLPVRNDDVALLVQELKISRKVQSLSVICAFMCCRQRSGRQRMNIHGFCLGPSMSR